MFLPSIGLLFAASVCYWPETMQSDHARAATTHSLLLFLSLASCHSRPTEPETQSDAEPAASRPPSTHVIGEGDHRHLIHLAKGDFLELPHEANFQWSVRFENASYFDDASPSGAGVARYRAVRSGIAQLRVLGDPIMCLHSDAACPLARYEWSVNVAIE
jgi:hypothetical protein